MKQVLRTELVGEQAKNQIAMEAAIRNEECIDYGATPLTLGGGCKINKIYVVKDRTGEIEEYGAFTKVRVQIADDEEESIMYSREDVVPYEMEILTIKTLEELEEALLTCDTEEDVEELDDSQLDFLLSNLYVSFMNKKKDDGKPSKEKLNKIAMENATRDREEIQYELSKPLVINETTLIESIHMIDPDDDDAYSRIVNKSFTNDEEDDYYLEQDGSEEDEVQDDEISNHCMHSVSYEQTFEDEENTYERMAREMEGSYFSKNLPMGQYHRIVIVFKDKPEVIKEQTRKLENARKQAFKENKDTLLALSEYEKLAKEILNEVPKYCMNIYTTLELSEIENLLLSCEDEEDIETVADNI